MITLLQRDEWVQLVPQFEDHSYRQCWDYGALLAERRSAESHHVAIRDGSNLLGLADVRIKRVPLLGGLAYISGGPLVRRANQPDIDCLAGCLAALRRHYVDEMGFVLRIQGSMGDVNWNMQATKCFLAHGFVQSQRGTPYRTMVVDLHRPIQDIRAALQQKWRNCLNKAERHHAATITTTKEEFDNFAALFADFVGRKGFHVDLDAKFFAELQSRLPNQESLLLTTIKSDDKLIAGHMSSMLGDTCVYLLGATADEALKTNAAYLLQWKVLTLAKERGMKWYDLGGIDPDGNPGVYHFKCGLAGVDVSAPGPFECVPTSIRGRLILGGEAAYRRLKNRTAKRLEKPAVKSS